MTAEVKRPRKVRSKAPLNDKGQPEVKSERCQVRLYPSQLKTIIALYGSVQGLIDSVD